VFQEEARLHNHNFIGTEHILLGLIDEGEGEGVAAARTSPTRFPQHVVAAGVRGRADAIGTANVRDYPVDILEPLNIEVIHPDDFLLDQLDPATPSDRLWRLRAAAQEPLFGGPYSSGQPAASDRSMQFQT
jgi:hypothetical protein